MLRIRLVTGDNTPANQAVIKHAQEMLREQFPGLLGDDIEKLPEQLRDPLSFGFVTRLFVAENAQGVMRGLAQLVYFSDLHVSYLELITAAPGQTGRGIGDALYERMREIALSLGSEALFFECLPDDPALSPDETIRAGNAARLKFYERFGARPIIGTAYETPIGDDATDPPYLVVDLLGKLTEAPRTLVVRAVEAILERKYHGALPQGYTESVMQSIVDDPVRLRPLRYVREKAKTSPVSASAPVADNRWLPVVVNDRHDIHHVHDRGYVEAPARVGAIWRALDEAGIAHKLPVKHYPERHITAVHTPELVLFLKRTCKLVGQGKSMYPYIFPVRNQSRPPKDQTVLAGYYCIDTFTPLNENAWLAARRAVDCTLTAADQVLDGKSVAYALVRPPGHHAESKVFGGFCYFNNSAIAANYLTAYGSVAILDIDYHHGNGQQEIFYERADVLTVSIHGDPSFAYPYFSGFADERGSGAGAGFNLNLPLGEHETPEGWLAALMKALDRIREFAPDYLVVAAGFDTAKGDPTGTWSNRAKDFHRIGQRIGDCGWPTLIVQEGGYRVRSLGGNIREFFNGLAIGQRTNRSAITSPERVTAASGGKATVPGDKARTAKVSSASWRNKVRPGDADRVRRLVDATGKFNQAEVGIAGELVEDRLAKGQKSGYEFLLAERQGQLLGYVCYGPIDGTSDSFDLYWIAVNPECQKQGIGRQLLQRSERSMADAGAYNVYIETSSTSAYAGTRAFYTSMGYAEQARLAGFYGPGDDKIIFVHQLQGIISAPFVGDPESLG
jgi:acetoin utilization deacetylase AcuC-like enzyme/GNAT superfamily N-acetyltransferase